MLDGGAAAAPPLSRRDDNDGGGAPPPPDHLGLDVSQASPMMNRRQQRLIHTLAQHAGGLPGTSSPRRRPRLGMIDGANGVGGSTRSLLSSMLGQGRGNVRAESEGERVPLAYCESCVSYGASRDGTTGNLITRTSASAASSSYASSSYESSTVSGSSGGSCTTTTTTTTTTTCVSCRRTMMVTSNLHPISPQGGTHAATGAGEPPDVSDKVVAGRSSRLHTLQERRESSAAGSPGHVDDGGGPAVNPDGDHEEGGAMDATTAPVPALGTSPPPSLHAMIPPHVTEEDDDQRPPSSPFMCGLGDALSGILCSTSNGAGRGGTGKRGSAHGGHPVRSSGGAEEDDVAAPSSTTPANGGAAAEFVTDGDGPGSDRAVAHLASEMEEVAAARASARRVVEKERALDAATARNRRRRSRLGVRERYADLVVEGLSVSGGGARPAEVEEGADAGVVDDSGPTDGSGGDGEGGRTLSGPGTETPSPSSQTTATSISTRSEAPDLKSSEESHDSSHASSRKENAAPPPPGGDPGKAEKNDAPSPPPLSDERLRRISNNSTEIASTATTKSAAHATSTPSSRRSSKILGRGRRHLATVKSGGGGDGGGGTGRSRSSSLRRKLSSKKKETASSPGRRRGRVMTATGGSSGRTASPHFGGRVVVDGRRVGRGATTATTATTNATRDDGPGRGRRAVERGNGRGKRMDEGAVVGEDEEEVSSPPTAGRTARTTSSSSPPSSVPVPETGGADVPETGVAAVVANGAADVESSSRAPPVRGGAGPLTRFMRHDDDKDVASKSPHSSSLRISSQMHREEFQDTYDGYRVSYPPDVVRDVVERVDTSIDPYFVAGRGVHVCSEPKASTLKVRGATYSRNGVKVPSKTSMFALLGVDSLLKDPHEQRGMLHCCERPGSYLSRLRRACERNGVVTPFLLVINMVVPWGNLLAYMYRPDGTNSGPFNEGRNDVASERCWKAFLSNPSEDYRNQKLKFIPRICVGPWMIKKTVGRNPAMIGQKLPTSYFGSLKENYLEICFDVAGGSQLANSIANAVVGSANAVTVDLGFVIEGSIDHEELPEQILGVFRLHHVAMKKAMTNEQWRQEVEKRERKRDEVDEDSKNLGPGMAEI